MLLADLGEPPFTEACRVVGLDRWWLKRRMDAVRGSDMAGRLARRYEFLDGPRVEDDPQTDGSQDTRLVAS